MTLGARTRARRTRETSAWASMQASTRPGGLRSYPARVPGGRAVCLDRLLRAWRGMAEVVGASARAPDLAEWVVARPGRSRRTIARIFPRDFSAGILFAGILGRPARRGRDAGLQQRAGRGAGIAPLRRNGFAPHPTGTPGRQAFRPASHAGRDPLVDTHSRVCAVQAARGSRLAQRLAERFPRPAHRPRYRSRSRDPPAAGQPCGRPGLPDTRPSSPGP